MLLFSLLFIIVLMIFGYVFISDKGKYIVYVCCLKLMVIG